MQRFADKVAFVTGGASGLGAATARRLADEGASVVVVDIDSARAQKVASELANGRAMTVDVSRSNDVEAAIAATVAELGRLDVVFNNAGVARPAEPLDAVTEEAWEQVLAVNAAGMFHASVTPSRQCSSAVVGRSSTLPRPPD